MSETVDIEWETWLRHRDDLVARHDGKAVLIKGADVIGIYDTWDLAVEEGVRRFGGAGFIAHRIAAVEEPIFLSAHARP